MARSKTRNRKPLTPERNERARHKFVEMFIIKKLNKDLEVVQATKEGKMYIKSEDFFKQERVISLIEKLEKSAIVEQIKTFNTKEK